MTFIKCNDTLNPLSAETDFKRRNLTSIDGHRRQILTSKVGPRTERVKYL